MFCTIARTDGFGAQFHSIMAVIAYCDHYGYTYAHQPLFNIDHSVDHHMMNDFIGMKGVTLLKDIPEDAKIEHILCPDEVHDSTTPNKFYRPAVITKLRAYYATGKQPQIEPIDVAIHIRRGDVGKDNHKRYTDNAIYKKVIATLSKTNKITVFSEGTYDDFQDLGLPEENFRLSTDVRETFHSLVKARVLVCSKSSFSYAAALLNENTVYYQDFWHAKLDNWLHIDELVHGPLIR